MNAAEKGASPGFCATAKRLGNILGTLLAVGLIAGFLSTAGGIALCLTPGPATQRQTVIIPKRSGSEEIGHILARAGQVNHAWQFTLPARLLAHGRLRAGEYELAPHMTVIDLIAKLQSGETVVHKLSVPEGLTSAEIVSLLQAAPVLTGEVKGIPPEGSLLPETYFYSYGDMREDILKRMRQHADAELRALWDKRAVDLPLASPEQARVLASIVEKETGVAAERPRIAGVFLNRLKRGIKLQSDPTVIYALTKGKKPLGRPLTHDDLATTSPYNTYEIAALPPGPIANPGRAALEAVMHPEINDYLYFVADGSGGHVFARTLEEHNANVARWRKLHEK